MKTALVAAFALVACSKSPAPAVKEVAPPPPVATTKGEIVRTSFKSAALGVDKDVIIYVPAGYAADANKHWPVFYYLHGLGAQETSWADRMHIGDVADQMSLGAIIVMPDGDDGFYSDSATPLDYDACMKDGTGLFDPSEPKKSTCVRAPKYETYIIDDLIPWVDKTYRTNATKQGRAIAGLSMGGFGALELAMRHKDLFAATVSHSGVDALLYQGPYPSVAGKVVLGDNPAKAPRDPISQWIAGIFGTDIANWRAHDPASLVDKLAPGELAIYLDCGTEDDFRLNNGAQYLHDLLLAKKIDHAWYLGPGRHDGEFWRARVPFSLKFLVEHTSPAK
jgi:S-formylglutathione hydrolase FrmB